MYDTPKNTEVIQETIESLKKNGIGALLTQSREEARAKILELVGTTDSVMTMTSVTLDELGIAEEINGSGKYNTVRTKLNDPSTDSDEKRALGAAPKVTIGSVHAVTKDGKVVIASNTGSQLPAYAHGAEKVIWVVGTQKIVENLDDAMKRIYEYVLPLESERAHKAYGVEGSFVSKILIMNREINPGRITVVFVPEKIGF